MKIEIKSTTRKVRHVDRFGAVGERLQPIVEVTIDGVPLIHECDSVEQSRVLALRLSQSVGLK